MPWSCARATANTSCSRRSSNPSPASTPATMATCDETGEAIGVGRLIARPTATLSLEAQQRRELKQKMFGD